MSEVIYGCRLLVVTALDTATGLPGTSTVSIETPQQFGVTPQFSDGQRQELRGGDKLIAVVEDDDELTGMDLTFTDALLNGPAMEIIGGGEWDDVTEKYTAPAIGAVKTPFEAKLYVAQYAEASQHQSDVEGYVLFTFPYCKGRIPNFTAQDRNFLVPQFTIKARENATANLRVFKWGKASELPV